MDKCTRPGFTLIELLVVVAIIGVLVGLSLPALAAARTVARGMACGSNLRQLSIGMHTYSVDHRGYLPHQFRGNPAQAAAVSPPEIPGDWFRRMRTRDYVQDIESVGTNNLAATRGFVWNCPFAGDLPLFDDVNAICHFAMNDALQGDRNGASGGGGAGPYQFRKTNPPVRLAFLNSNTVLLGEGDGRLIGSEWTFDRRVIKAQDPVGPPGTPANATPWQVDADGGLWDHGGTVNLSRVDGSGFSVNEWVAAELQEDFKR